MGKARVGRTVSKSKGKRSGGELLHRRCKCRGFWAGKEGKGRKEEKDNDGNFGKGH